MLITAMILGGLVLLFFGGESLVNGAVAVARKLGISPLLIGLVLVGFGTSTPELITSVIAAMNDTPGLALGNVLGSNIANILLILGATAVIVPLVCQKAAFKKDGMFMLVATLMALGVCLYGTLSRPIGIVFLVALAGYIIYSIWLEKHNETGSADLEHADLDPEEGDVAEVTIPGFRGTLFFSVLQFIFGLVLTFLGAKILVKGSVELAQNFGVSDTIIGLTIVAIGTSLPELVASLMAAFKKQADIAYGNIIGSNIYNILGILGVTAVLHPFQIDPDIARIDIWIMLAATLGLLFASFTRWTIVRWEGAVFLLGYVAYIASLIWRASHVA
ncbi:MAG: calcium/sodium antiporter [Pseudobdellovibrionaceae bacterium]